MNPEVEENYKKPPVLLWRNIVLRKMVLLVKNQNLNLVQVIFSLCLGAVGALSLRKKLNKQSKSIKETSLSLNKMVAPLHRLQTMVRIYLIPVVPIVMITSKRARVILGVISLKMILRIYLIPMVPIVMITSKRAILGVTSLKVILRIHSLPMVPKVVTTFGNY